MVRSQTTKPSFWSSPWILGAPQVGFSAARQPMSARISAVAFGLPARARDCHFQKSRNPARCQATTVSGFTATRTSAHRDQMQCRVIQNSRSNRFNRGRGRFRLRRMSCCRKARISRAVSFRLRKKTWTAARRARMNRSMNPVCSTRSIIHQGRFCRNPQNRKLLIAEPDRVLATHTC